MYSADGVRAIVERALPGLEDFEPEPLAGADFSTWRVARDAVVKFARDQLARRGLVREVAAISAVRSRTSVPVPLCLYASQPDRDDPPFAVFSWIDGQPLEAVRLAPGAVAMRELIEFLTDIHAIDVHTLAPELAPWDKRGTPLAAFARAADQRAALEPMLGRLPPATSAFLAGEFPVPELPARDPVFSHTDLKGEHILIGADGSVSGVIDWADAATVHPVSDYVGLVISVGLEPLARAMRGHGDEDLLLAAAHYARCAGLENLGARLAGLNDAPLDLLLRQIARAFEGTS